jgi:hypothetical protein
MSKFIRVGERTIRCFMDGEVPPDVQEWQGPPRPRTEDDEKGEADALKALAALLLEVARARLARKSKGEVEGGKEG